MVNCKKNQVINPLTNRCIKLGGPTFVKLVKAGVLTSGGNKRRSFNENPMQQREQQSGSRIPVNSAYKRVQIVVVPYLLKDGRIYTGREVPPGVDFKSRKAFEVVKSSFDSGFTSVLEQGGRVEIFWDERNEYYLVNANAKKLPLKYLRDTLAHEYKMYSADTWMEGDIRISPDYELALGIGKVSIIR
jgi:hypothetical protein